MGYRTKNATILVSDLRALHAAELVEEPSGFTFVTVTADYDLANGLDPVGAVSFIPSEPMINGETVVSASVTRALNIDGVLLIDLAANTDPGTTTPSGDAAYYLVEESINGATRRFSVVVPHDAGPIVNLADLTHTLIDEATLPRPTSVSAFPKVIYPVAGPAGPPGPPGPIGPQGDTGADLVVEPWVVNFAQRSGVDSTGVTACDAALAAVVATANHGSPIQLMFPAGTYKFTGAWPNIDPMSVTMVGAGAALTKIDMTGLASTTTAVAVAWSDSGHMNQCRVFSGLRFAGPADATTTFAVFGGSSIYSPFMSFDDVTVSGFGTQLKYQANAWLHTWTGCAFFGSQTTAVSFTTATTAGENMAFVGCSFYDHVQETVKARMNGLSAFFTNCSFDYNGRAVDMDRGYIQLVGCHIEGDDTRVATGANEYFLISDTSGQPAPRLVVNGGWIYPAWATRPRVFTTGGTGIATLTLRDTKVSTPPNQPGLALVVDSASAPSRVVLDEVQQETSLAVPATAQVRTNGNNTLTHATAPTHTLAGPSAATRDIKLATISSGAVSDRWMFRATGAETGTNEGTNFSILCRQDDGTALYTPIAIKRATGIVTLGRGLTHAVPTQTLSSNGAVTINAYNGTIHAVTLAANATSSSIINPNTGQIITIEWIQDGTGSRTYAWPTNCKFAAGTAPTASTTAAYRDSVTFRYDGTNWLEMSRAVGVH